MSDEKIDNHDEMSELLREFEENPYDTSRKTPDDVMRIFYQFNLPILPVVSRRGKLIGVITKDSITAEMSDIDRSCSRKVDDFITSLAKKMPLDDLLPYLSRVNEFTTINIFGEIQGRWSRSDLVAACECPTQSVCSEDEIASSRDKQAMEWMIYTILEYIPRALYAVNSEGKTIFYNSHFEDLYNGMMKTEEVDHVNVEKILMDPALNHCTFGDSARDAVFENSTLGLSYERVTIYSNGAVSGYLLYFGKSAQQHSEKGEHSSLSDRVDMAERQIIVNELRRCAGDISVTAKKLQIGKAALLKKVEKHGIALDKKQK